MKLRALELEQFRKFDRRVRVAGIADGLNLVVGPNEMGKSTLFAALQAVLFERHRSQAQTVRSLHPAGHEGASPHVALEFEAGGQRYRIEKRFLRRPSAELLLPDGRQLHGEAAEEALERLLAGGDAVGAGGNRRGTPDALGVWSLLWVGQGQSFVQPALAAGARDTLQAALDSQIGEILAGDQGGALLGELERAWQELVYKTGKPRGRYKEADDARKALEGEVAGLAARQDELERDRDELDRVRADYERLQAAQSDGQEEVQLAELTARRDRLTVQRAEIREAAADLATARHDRARAEAERARRQALRAALVEAEAELAAATFCRERDDGRGGGSRRGGAHPDRRGRAPAGDPRASRDLAPAACSAWPRRSGSATTAVRRCGPRRARSRSRSSRRRSSGCGSMTGRSTRPAARCGSSSRSRSRSPGSAASGSGRWSPTAGVCRAACARPSGGSRASSRCLASARRPARPASWSSSCAARRRSPARRPSLRRTPRKRRAGPRPRRSRPRRARRRRQIGALAAQLRPARRELDLLLDARHREGAARDQAAERRAQAERRLASSSAASSPPPSARPTRACSPHGWPGCRARSPSPSSACASSRRSCPRTRSRISSGGSVSCARWSRAEARRCASASSRCEGLRGRIHALAGGGLDERLAGERRRLDELERECLKYQRDAEALALLVATLRGAERDAKERYLGPLIGRIRPYLQALFPGAELEIDAAFRIIAVARAGAPEPFERLSDGTREQLAVLVRLAFAELLAE